MTANGCGMTSSGLKTMNLQNMTKDNKEQKLSDSTEPAIGFIPCYRLPFIRLLIKKQK